MKKYFITSLLGLLLLSCNNSNSKKDTEKVVINSDGTTIDYTDTRIGDTTLLFIHGWNIDKTYWENQINYFKNNYRVVTIDLPGFGKSGKNRQNWTVENYRKDVVTVIETLNLQHVMLIGHSMSGAIIVETAKAHPELISGIIGIDNLKGIDFVMTPAIKKEWAGFYAAARKNYKKTISEGMQQLFSPSTNDAVRQRVAKDFLNVDTTIAVDVLENLDAYPFLEKLKSFNKVIYLINSDFQPTDTSAFQKNNIQYGLLNIGPTGHYPMLEKPDEFNLLLQQAVDKIGKDLE